MDKIKVDHLDIPIIRSCNLACVGCITHSNHKKIKGIVRLADSLDWLNFWNQKIQPKAITLFGGEPLLHPEFADWAVAIKNIWGKSVGINVNTNGYYLENLYDKIPVLFNTDLELSIVISTQTGIEPYLSTVKNNVETLKQKIIDYHLSRPGIRTAHWRLWLDELEINTKQWYGLVVNDHETGIALTTCQQYQLPWTTHYTGIGETMKPVYQYNDIHYEENHKSCQTDEFVTLYRGRMYKCPPMGVLNHTLTTFNLTEDPDWKPYLNDYKTVGPDSTDEEIAEWFAGQKNPEKVCNMCGFTGPKGHTITSDERSHVLKNYWNYTL